MKVSTGMVSNPQTSTITSHLKTMNTKITTTYGDGNPGPGL